MFENKSENYKMMAKIFLKNSKKFKPNEKKTITFFFNLFQFQFVKNSIIFIKKNIYFKPFSKYLFRNRNNRMTDVSNLKINQLPNVERSNLRVT